MTRRRYIWAVLSLGLLSGCYRSSLGMRGIAGLGEVMTKGNRVVTEEEIRPRVIDVHTFFEAANDEQAIHPGIGMEVAFKAANVLGAAVLLQHMRFYPKLDEKTAARLVLCGTPEGMKALVSGVEKGRFRCVRARLSEVNGEVASLAERHRIPVVLDTPGGDRAPRWEALFRKYPRVTFVVAGLGHPWEKELAPLVAGLGNVYADTAVPIEGAISRNFREVALEVGESLVPFKGSPQKLIFGSGWPKSIITTHIEAVLLTFPREVRDVILHGNANRLFGLNLPADRFLTGSVDGGKQENPPPR